MADPVTADQFAADAGASTATVTAAPAGTQAAPSAQPTTTPVTPSATAPAAPAPASASTDSGFKEVSQAQFNAMTPRQQQNYLNAKSEADAQTSGDGGDGTTISAADLRKYGPGVLSSNPGAIKPSGTSTTYTPPAPAKASDYVSDKQFIPQIKDPVTGQMRDVTDADVPKATNWDVTPDQTVQGQMTKLTTDLQNNPVYQSLADEMKRVNAAAGGGNSLMAESAAYDKVIGLAYNIASNDAATFAKSAEFNASMANQFGLAEGAFIHTALLSDQNYKQSQILQSEQIKGNLDSVDRQIAGQIESTTIAGNAQVSAAGIQAGGQISSAQIYANASEKDAQLQAATSLTEANLSRQTTLDSLGIQFQSSWALQQGAQANNLQTIGAQAGAQIDVNAASAADQFAKSLTLQNNADMNANLRQLMANIGQIGATPGLTAEQQANAIKTETDIFKTNTALTNSAYSSAAHGIADGSIGNSLINPTVTTQPTAANPYGIYGNYMAYPGFDTTPPPVLPFYGGTGAQQNVGAQTGNPNLPANPVANGPAFIPPPAVAPHP